MSVRNPRLPLLPGYSPNTMIGKTRFGVRPIFTSIGGTNMLIDKEQQRNLVPSLYARKSAPDLPTWIIYDKQILRFQAYFQQTLQEMRDPAIIRKVDIFYFLEDGTIKVMEPKTENSGLLQGVLISRQRIRIPFSHNVYYDVLDLNVGREVQFYGKVFKIVNCDNFTRVFLNRLGINVPDPINMPSYASKKHGAFVPQGRTRHFGFKQFLELDGKVLRFYGYWDDRESEFGTIHQMEVHYFLADDQMEIKEVYSGHEAAPMFLKKSVLPKKLPPHVEMSEWHTTPSYTPADLAVGAVLNVYGRKVVLTDCDAFTKEYYRAKYGVDNFTALPTPADRSSECVSTSVEERKLPPWNGYGSYEDSAENCRTVEPKPPHRDFVKFLNKDRVGFDSHVLRFAARLIIPDVPNNELRYFVVSYYLCDDTIGVFELAERNSGFKGGRFLKRDTAYKPGYERFAPQPPPTYGPRDMWIGNELVLSEHTFRLVAADEYALRYMELHAGEFPQANVGLIMDKIRSVLTAQENGYKNFVSRYMNAVVPEKKELMSVRCFKQAMKEILCDKMTEHEFVTVVRYFRGDAGREHRPHREMIRSLVFTVMTRELWDDRTRLHEALLHADETGRGVLTRHRLRQLLRACRLPLHDDLMDCLLRTYLVFTVLTRELWDDRARLHEPLLHAEERGRGVLTRHQLRQLLRVCSLPLHEDLIDCLLRTLDKDDDCNVRYEDLLEFLDFKTRPVTAGVSEEELRRLVRHAPPLKDTECLEWECADTLVSEGYVNWSAFLCQLNLEPVPKE